MRFSGLNVSKRQPQLHDFNVEFVLFVDRYDLEDHPTIDALCRIGTSGAVDPSRLRGFERSGCHASSESWRCRTGH